MINIFEFHISKDSIESIRESIFNNISNTFGYNGFYTIFSLDNNYLDRIDINLTSSTFEVLNQMYYEMDSIIITDIIIDVLIETIQHEYLHKAMGIDINISMNRNSCDYIIERLIND